MKRILFILTICLVCSISVFSQSNKKWEKTQTLNSIEGYQEFLLKYPNGEYTELAKQKLNVLQKQKVQKDSIRMIEIEKQIKIGENIISGITIQEALVILSMEKYESMIFPTGAINFTGTATVSGFEMVVEKGIVKSKKVIPEDLGTGNFATSTMLDKIEIR